MCSSTGRDTAFGPKLTTRSGTTRANGYSDSNTPATGRAEQRRHHASGLHALVERTGTVLPAAVARYWSDRIAALVLGGDRIRVRHVIPLGRSSGPAALPGLFLSGRADPDS